MIRVFASPTRVSVSLMVFLTLVATWIRLWQFPHIPPAFNYDEAYNVLDSLWLWETGSQVAFLPGNTGRHALYHYLAIPFLLGLGVNTFALRFLSVLIGIVTVPLTYRWVKILFAPRPERYYLGLIASAGLAFSFWHITLSRSGFRASLLLLLYVLMAYLFWQGWRRQSIWHMAGAGVALGLSQYTYWLAALLPVQFGLFVLIWSLRQRQNWRHLWLGIGVMALTSFIVFIPLGWHYLDTPLVLQYVRQSSIADRIANDPQTTWSGHLLTALQIYLDGPVGLWQGRFSLSFDWLVLSGFWVGLIVAIWRWKQPASLFLLTGLLVLWLPAPLNDIDFSDLRLPDMLPVHHAISNLRLAGVLPIYYTLVAVGLFSAAQFLSQKLFHHRQSGQIGLTTFVLIFVVSGGLNSYNFFVRWPQQPNLYERYNGPEFELAQDLLRDSYSHDILLPFHLYTHPTVQMILHNQFTEVDTPPSVDPQRPTVLVTTDDAPQATYVWLTRSKGGAGEAYLTPPIDKNTLLKLTDQTVQSYQLAAPVFIRVQTYLLANLGALESTLITPWSVPNPVDYAWNNEVKLAGYQISPRWAHSNDAVELTLYWQNLTDQPLTHDIFVHVINSQGQGVDQLDGLMVGDAHRWRKGKLSPSHHTIQLGDRLASGPYLVRLGLFNTRTGNRLAVVNGSREKIGDQAIISLFYVTTGDSLPPQPNTLTQATLGDRIEVLGYTMPAMIPRDNTGDKTTISPTLYWQATQPVAKDYTIFLQLLNADNQFVTGFDTQPLNGNYPTSRWQPGELVAQTIDLILPPQLPAGEYHLVTGMYNFQSGERLAATGHQRGQLLRDNAVILANLQVTPEWFILNSPKESN